MPDYRLGKLYIITSETNKLIYIGSTSQKYISTRISGHIKDYKNGKRKCKSYKLIECDDYNYKLLKDFPCSNKQQLKREEGFWILHYKEQPDYECVNKNIAGRTYKEWCDDNRDKIKERKKEWRENNRDKTKEHYKKWYDNNKDKAKEHYKKWYDNNKDKAKEQSKKYYQNNKDKVKEWHRKNRDKIKAQMKEYRENKKINK